MGPITLENVRASSDITVKVRLKDGGMYIAWTSLADIKAYIFSDAQRAIAGRCDVSIDGDDSTLLICNYSANKPQYPGVNSIVIRANYDGRVKTYDRRAFNIVKRTSSVAGDVVLDDPVVDLELEVADVSSSLLDMAIALAFKAVDEWDQVTVTERGPEGKSAYRVAVDNGFVGTEDEWLESLVGPEGPRGRQGEEGEPGPAGVTSATVHLEDSAGTPSASASVEEGVLHLEFSGLKGEQGPRGERGLTGMTGPAGETGPAGKSAYQVAVDEGFEGDEEAWLASLVGPQGPQGPQGIQGEQGPQGEGGPAGVTSAVVTVENTTGTPSATASVNDGLLSIAISGIKGEQGVGFDSVESPTPADGTLTITLSNGDEVTLDLNHNHPQYAKTVLCASVADYEAISYKDSMTLYAIPGIALYLGDTLLIEQSEPLPYTPVAYIQTDGVAFIDTGINGNAPMSFKLKMTPVAPASGNTYIIGSRKDSGNTRFALPVITNDKKVTLAYYSGVGEGLSVSDSVDNQTPMDVKGILRNGEEIIEAKQAAESTYSQFTVTYNNTVTTDVSLYIFGLHYPGNTYTAASGTKFFNVKIYAGDNYANLVFNGVACYYEGEYGLWDKVSDSFFGNAAGSGAFSGPQI